MHVEENGGASSTDRFGTVVVGAGQAGLAISHLLLAAGISHVVLERGLIGSSWRDQRWDSFTVNTPAWSNLLPGSTLVDEDEHAFATRDELIGYFEDYAAALPIRQGSTVTSVERRDDGHFLVRATTGDISAANVIVCSGGLSTPVLPAIAGDAPAGITTHTAGTYRNPAGLPEGGVVVVGSGQSGCQIAEELLEAGRVVHLCVSKVARFPRRHRGRDIIAWLVDMGFFELPLGKLDPPAMRYAAQPQVSGTLGGHTVSLQSLVRDGARLLGRVDGFSGATMKLRRTVVDCAAFADEKSAGIKAAIDDHIAANGILAPAATPDPNEPDIDLTGQGEVDEFDLPEAGVTSIIWCTGFTGDFSWIHHEVHDERGQPRHLDGVSEVPGLYFLGMPWLSKRKSGILLGVAEVPTGCSNTSWPGRPESSYPPGCSRRRRIAATSWREVSSSTSTISRRALGRSRSIRSGVLTILQMSSTGSSSRPASR